MIDAGPALRLPLRGGRLELRVSPLHLAAGLTILALAVRLIDLGSKPFWLDEAYSAWFSARGWHELWTVVPSYEPHPPFYYSLLKLWRDLAGGSAFALRFFSVLFGIAAIPVVVAAALELERQDPTRRPLLGAGVAGGLAALSPMLILLDREARPYPLLIFAYAVAMLGLLRLLREFRSGAGTWASWAMLTGGAEIALWAHGLGALYALTLALALAPAWLRQPLDRPRLIRGIVAAGVVAALYLPCLLMVLARAGDWGKGWLDWEPDKLLELIGLYTVPYEALTIGSAVPAIVMILLAKRAMQFALAARGWSAERAIFLLWWGPPLMAIAISALAMPVFLPRTLAATLVPAYLAMGAAVARAGSRTERIALAGALSIPLVVTAFQVALRPAAEQWDAVSAYLERHAGPRDQVWLYPNDSALPLRETHLTIPVRGIPGDYPAIGYKGPIRAGSPAVVSLTADQARQIAVDPAVRAIPVIWLVSRQSGLFDPGADLPRALSRVRTPGRAQHWGYIEVRPYSARG